MEPPHYRDLTKHCAPCTEPKFHFMIITIVVVVVSAIGTVVYYMKDSIQQLYDRNEEAILVAKNHGTVAMVTVQVRPRII